MRKGKYEVISTRYEVGIVMLSLSKHLGTQKHFDKLSVTTGGSKGQEAYKK